MQYFKDFQSFSDHEIELQLLQLNESNLTDFVRNIVDKVKASEDKNAAIERVLSKAIAVKKELVPLLVAAFLLTGSLDNIDRSKVLSDKDKAYIAKMIEKEKIEKERARISAIDSAYYDKIGFKESSNDWTKANDVGYIGKYQFGTIAFLDVDKDIKVKYLKKQKGTKREKIHKLIDDFSKISNDTTLTQEDKAKKLDSIFPLAEQELMMKILTKHNEHYLRNYKKYIGEEINGIKITWSGMLAAAHLKGAKSVKIYLDSCGKTIPKDLNGTSVEKYIQMFK